MNRLLLSFAGLFAIAGIGQAQDAPSYARHVRPFLAKYCLECHNAKSLKGGINLETHKAILEGEDSENAKVLVPGQPDKSPLVLGTEGKKKPAMPPMKA